MSDMSATAQTVLPPVEDTAAVPSDLIWRLSVDQYHAMIQSGILTEDDPVELLEGWLVFKMPKNPPHSVVNGLVSEALSDILPAGWYANSQEPITTLDSEPEPDVAVVRGTRRDYLSRHPGPGDLALVVEVSDATLRRDQTLKRRLYAASGIEVYWIVNLPESQIEVYTQPSGPAGDADYGHRQIYGPSDSVPVVIGGDEVGRVAVRDVLP